MMIVKAGTFSVALAVLMISAAQAQVTIDVSKITCEQFRNYAITDPSNIATWLSGYYNGRRNNTIVEAQGFKHNLERLKDYCITNRTVTVMQAIEAILGNENSGK
jgi:hypothetical protein